MQDMDHSKHAGKRIHESKVQGYQLAYHLLDLPDRDVQHLMLYIVNPKGHAITRAKVGYLVTGPDGTKQKVMAMAMKDSFGGDVNLNLKGVYEIKTKVVIENEKLLDQLTYQLD